MTWQSASPSTSPPLPPDDVAVCLSLDYTCFTKRECMVSITNDLAANAHAQHATNRFLALLLLIPPALIFTSHLASGFQKLLRSKAEKERDRAVATATEAAAGSSANLPVTELFCSIAMLVFLAPALRIAAQLMVGGEQQWDG
jgi:hypothetical protein